MSYTTSIVENGEHTARPTGKCYCGCGTQVPPNKFWAVGHDKRLTGEVIALQYGNIANFALAHGRGPDRRSL